MPTESIPNIDIHTPPSLDGGRPQLSPEATRDAARRVEETLQAWGAPTDHLEAPDQTPAAPDQVTTPNAPRTWEHLDGQMIAYDSDGGNKDVMQQRVRFEREGDELDWSANRYTNGPDRKILLWVEDKDAGVENSVLIRGNDAYIFKPQTPDQPATYQRVTLPAMAVVFGDELPNATIGEAYSLPGTINGRSVSIDVGQKLIAADVEVAGAHIQDIDKSNNAKPGLIQFRDDDIFKTFETIADGVDAKLGAKGILRKSGQVGTVIVINDGEVSRARAIDESTPEAPVTPVDPADAPTQSNQVPDPADAPTDPLDVVDPAPNPTPADPPTQPMPTRSNEAPGVDNMSQETKDLLAWKAGRMPKAKRIPGVDPEANATAVDGRFEYEPTPSGEVYVVDAIWRQNTPVKWDSFSAARRLNRQIMIATEDDKQYVVQGDRMYDLAASAEQGKPVSVELAADEALPDATIGQPWQSKLGDTGPIARVEIVQTTLKQADTNQANGVENPFSIVQSLKAQHIEQTTKEQRSKIVQKAEAARKRSPAAMQRALAAGARVAKKAGPGIMKASDKFYAGANKIGKGMGDVKARMAETVKVRNARIGAFVTALAEEMPAKAAFEAELVRQFVAQDIETEAEAEAEAGFARGVMDAIYLRGLRTRRQAEATKRAWGRRKDGEDDNSDPANVPW